MNSLGIDINESNTSTDNDTQTESKEYKHPSISNEIFIQHSVGYLLCLKRIIIILFTSNKHHKTKKEYSNHKSFIVLHDMVAK